MKILLINLCLRPGAKQKIYPVGLGYVASSIFREKFNLEIIDIDINRYNDIELEGILSKKDFDVVGFGCIVTGYRIVKKLCSMIKLINRDAIIIVGNSVSSSIPELLLSKTLADIAVIGEGDITVIELLKAIDGGKPLEEVDGIYFKKKNKIFSTKPRDPILDLNSIPLPNWDLFDIPVYIEGYKSFINEPYPIPKEQIRVFPVNTARGCIYKCTFCYHVFRGNKYRFRSPDSIINEIRELKRLYSINYIHFWDELTFFSKKQLGEFINKVLIEDLNIFWTATCRSDLFQSDTDTELAKRLRHSGCIGLSYSLESGDNAILESMNKRLEPEDFSRQKRILDRAGLLTWTSLVFGYPGETEESIEKTMNICFDNNIYPSVGYLLPQPGTPIYNGILKKGIISDEEEYLLNLGDRQDLMINLTCIPSERFEALIKFHLNRINQKLGLKIAENNLIKTGNYKAKTPQEGWNLET